MDFSDSIPCTASPAFSPNQRYFATSQDYRLTVRHCDSLQVEAVYSCLDRLGENAENLGYLQYEWHAPWLASTNSLSEYSVLLAAG